MLIYWRQSLLVLAAATSVARCLKLPTLAELQTLLPSAREPEPLVVDTVLQLDVKPTPGRLTLFRERNGWCPYSERVFLAFEHKKLSYDTFLIDNMGRRPDW